MVTLSELCAICLCYLPLFMLGHPTLVEEHSQRGLCSSVCSQTRHCTIAGVFVFET